jgi:hypothetical protein
MTFSRRAAAEMTRRVERQGVGLARTCSRDDERRARRAVLFPNAMLNGPPLRRV